MLKKCAWEHVHFVFLFLFEWDMGRGGAGIKPLPAILSDSTETTNR